MKYVIAICLTFAAISSAFAAEMSHEETVVRNAYAKFAYAAEQKVVGDLASEANGAHVWEGNVVLTTGQRLAAAQVDFTLQDFVVGNISDILTRKAVDLISPAAGEELAAGLAQGGFDDRGLATHWSGIEPGWRPARVLSPGLLAITIADEYREAWQKDSPNAVWERYASYSVTVSFQGKSSGPYKALFAFGHDNKGNEVIEPEDATVSVTALGFVLKTQLFPASFALSHMRTFPVVSDWLQARQMFSQSCPVGQGDVCCDLVELKCGPGRDDLAAALNKPLPDGTPAPTKP